MWGPTMVGYGQYHYRYATGREGDFLATGFSPRKANLSIYIMPGYQDYGAILAAGQAQDREVVPLHQQAGDVDIDVLEELDPRGSEGPR
jgi:hypothetical protein